MRWIILVALCAISTEAFAQECVPTCRAGYMCNQGQCISRCNPACPDTQTCTDAGTCVASSPAQYPAAQPVVPTPAAAAAGAVPDPRLQALTQERALLMRRTHRLGGPMFLTIFGGMLFLAGGIGSAVLLPGCDGDCSHTIWAPIELAVGSVLLPLGIWRLRVKLRRREDQRRRLEEIDQQLRVDLRFGPTRAGLSFAF